MTESIAGTYRADLGTLATLGPVKFNDKLKGLLTTAHPTLMEDGTLINLINGVCPRLLVFPVLCPFNHACSFYTQRHSSQYVSTGLVAVGRD